MGFVSPSKMVPTLFFFFNDTATTEIYTLSLHGALPIYLRANSIVSLAVEELALHIRALARRLFGDERAAVPVADRKSTRLNSSHANISYAVFCLKQEIECRYRDVASLRTVSVWRRFGRI